MKDFRPQVLIGILILGVVAYIAMQLGFDQIAALSAGGIVSAVTVLAQNGITKE